MVKLISGGQTGADRAALDIAIEKGLAYGGSIPKGRLAEDGPIDLDKYPCLTELDSGNYLARTRKNVIDSDATLAFTLGALTGGTRKTIEFAREYGKPYLHINIKKVPGGEAVRMIEAWLSQERPAVLNVAGSKESGAPGIYSEVYNILKAVLK